MHHTSGHLFAHDGTRLATRAWRPSSPARATALLVHGLGEHIGRHERLAVDLVRAGYAVHGFDLRGHGYSQGPRVHARRLDVLLADVGLVAHSVRHEAVVAHAVRDEARLAHAVPGGGPFVLIGHSMGGLLAARAVQEGFVAPDALVLSAPLLAFANPPPRLVVRLVMALAEPFPRMPVAALDPRRISSVPAESESYRLDPAVYHGPMKARMLAEVIRHGRRALAQPERVTVPTLVLQGKEDAVVDVASNGRFASALPDGTLQLYDACRHEFFHDVLGERATRDLVAWLGQRL